MAAWISAGVGKAAGGGGEAAPAGLGVETRKGPKGWLLAFFFFLFFLWKRGSIPFREEPPSGVPARRGAGLPEREPIGVPPLDRLSFSFFVLPASLRSAPEAAPASTSLPDPGPPPTMRLLFLLAWK